MIRIGIDQIPDYPKVCRVRKMCPYRGLTARTADDAIWCDNPRANKGNSDAACRWMKNKDLIEKLGNRP